LTYAKNKTYNIGVFDICQKLCKGGGEMPRRDGTGPNGLGAGTGRGAGECLRPAQVAFDGYGFRRGFRRIYPNVSVLDENSLKAEKAALEARLDAINHRLNP
jgi:hypothetical protein